MPHATRAPGAATYDVVVVGAGSAGCALAARLSEDPSLTVCLIEAGPSVHPAMARPNLHVLSDVTCEGLRLEGKRAIAVRLARGSERFEIAAAREIVLAAGAIGSPHLLMLSGIGPGAALTQHGIAVAHDLPGVGENLQDHVDNALVYADRTRTAHAGTWRGLMRLGASALGYALRRDGTLASNMVEAGGFLRSRPGLEQPDVQYHFMPLLLDRARILPADHGFILHAAVLRPKSRGRLTLRSRDPHVAPVLHAGFYSDPEGEDMRTMLRGLRIGRQLVAAPAFARYRGDELAPGAAVMSDADLEAYARASVGTVFHPVGTCRMGRGADAVVDARLRVHGIEGLRVADASIMPTIVSGNTNAPAIMIGERCADFMRAELRSKMVA